MQYLAKITGEQREGNLWKYDFIDLNTGNENSFYHGQKLNYISIFAGRLELFWDEEKQVNLWQSFGQDITVCKLNVRFWRQDYPKILT